MKKIGLVFRYSFTVYFLTLFVLSFVLLLPFFLFTLYIKSLHKFAHKLRVLWAWGLLIAIGVIPKISRKARLSSRQAYIFVPNHASYIDIVLMAISVPVFFRFMAKAELQQIPVFGMFFKTLDIAVDRKNQTKAAKSIRLAANALKCNQSITIFPEGTIPPNAPALGRFKMGAFKLAAELKLPLVPVTFLDNWRILPDKPFPPGRPGIVRIIIHEPIWPSDLNLQLTDGMLEKELARIVFDKHEITLRQFGVIQ